MKEFKRFYTESTNQRFDLSKYKEIDTNRFGKYDFVRPPRKGYIVPFNLNLFTTRTRRNLERFINDYFFTFNEVLISPVTRNRLHRETKRPVYANSYFVIGTDYTGEDVVYARIETASESAGQTKLYWRNRQMPMTDYVLPIQQRFKIAKDADDKDKIVDIALEVF